MAKTTNKLSRMVQRKDFARKLQGFNVDMLNRRDVFANLRTAVPGLNITDTGTDRDLIQACFMLALWTFNRTVDEEEFN